MRSKKGDLEMRQIVLIILVAVILAISIYIIYNSYESIKDKLLEIF